MLFRSALYIALALADKAPKVKTPPSDVIAIADFPEAGDHQHARGYVVFTSPDGEKVDVHLEMTGLPQEGGPFVYHIHDNAVPADGNCEGAGMHFNPYAAPPECSEQKGDLYCQVGDLLGKHGWLNLTCVQMGYLDPYLLLHPQLKAYIVGRLVVFHYADLTKFACATIRLALEEQKAMLREYGVLAERRKRDLDDYVEILNAVSEAVSATSEVLAATLAPTHSYTRRLENVLAAYNWLNRLTVYVAQDGAVGPGPVWLLLAGAVAIGAWAF